MTFYIKDENILEDNRKRRCSKGFVFLPNGFTLKNCKCTLDCDKLQADDECGYGEHETGFHWEDVRQKGILGLFFEECL